MDVDEASDKEAPLAPLDTSEFIIGHWACAISVLAQLLLDISLQVVILAPMPALYNKSTADL